MYTFPIGHALLAIRYWLRDTTAILTKNMLGALILGNLFMLFVVFVVIKAILCGKAKHTQQATGNRQQGMGIGDI